MPDENETTAERIARERRERDDAVAAELSARVAADADPAAQERKNAAMRDANDKDKGTHEPPGPRSSTAVTERLPGQVAGTENLTDEDRDKIRRGESGFDLGEEHVRPRLDREPTLVADGSRSPHDITSDGGNKQEAAHRHERQRLERTAAATAAAAPVTAGAEISVDKGLQPATDRPLSPSPVAAEDRNTAAGIRMTPTPQQAEQVQTLKGGDGSQTASDDPNRNPVTGAAGMSTSSESSTTGKEQG